MPVLEDASSIDRRRLCGWCEGEIPARARGDAKFCSTRCRQASHRFGRGLRLRVATGHPLRLAYADPPYPGKAGIYRDHPDFGGEVDHSRLVEQLDADFPDGWALSTSAAALRDVLASCPPAVRVAAWFRGERPTRSWQPLNAWEPVIVARGRAYLSNVDGRRLDALIHHARPRTTDPHRVVGAKPAAFCWWLFDLLGALPGDELVDLFPGSGGVARAWARYSGPVDAAAVADPHTTNRRADAVDASSPPGSDAFAEVLSDASVGGEDGDDAALGDAG